MGDVAKRKGSGGRKCGKRKGDILISVLEVIKDMSVGSVDLFFAIMSAGYGASARSIEYEMRRAKRERIQERWKEEQVDTKKEARQKYHVLMYSLKRAGLIEEVVKGNNKILTLTDKGLRKLKNLQKVRTSMLPRGMYKKEKCRKSVVVIFDIPEKFSKKRKWLRGALKILGFSMVQRSVWMGKVKIPAELIEDLRELEIAQYVEIFEVTELASLKYAQ